MLRKPSVPTLISHNNGLDSRAPKIKIWTLTVLCGIYLFCFLFWPDSHMVMASSVSDSYLTALQYIRNIYIGGQFRHLDWRALLFSEV